MKKIATFLTLLLILISSADLKSATKEEMEKARTIAAKAYLRYANDGSGYLDELNPSSIAELEKSLKTKEKENLKAFKDIPVPSDYASWDKQKLIEYWSVTAFQNKSLIEKGKLGRNRAKKQIGNMNVTVVKSEPQKPVAQEAPKTTSSTTESTTSSASTEAPQASKEAAMNVAETVPEINEAALQADENNVDAIGDIEIENTAPKESSDTWVYIMLLSILVAVVIGLMVFASKVFKKDVSPKGSPKKSGRKYSESEFNAMDDNFMETLAEKNEEIAELSKKLENANSQNASLKNKLEALTAEIASLRTRLAENRQTANTQESTSQHMQRVEPANEHHHKDNYRIEEPPKTPHPPVESNPNIRTIYLGRANAKNIFVRADRNLNIGNSVYRLDTTDGFSGTFRVVDNPLVWDMALRNPEEYLSGGCTGKDLDNTKGKTKIVTESAGTAIFEGGCWKVIRKARIAYE